MKDEREYGVKSEDPKKEPEEVVVPEEVAPKEEAAPKAGKIEWVRDEKTNKLVKK